MAKRGSEAAGEEQPDKLWKTVRFEQEAPSAAASSDPTVALDYPASGETQDRPGSVLVQKSGHVDDDVQIFCVGCIPRDGWNERVVTLEKCWIGIEEKNWKSNQMVVTDQKSWKTWKSKQNIVINEEFVQNVVMNEELVQNSVMNEHLSQNSVMNEEFVQNGVMNEEFVQNSVMTEEWVQNSVMNGELVQKGVMNEKFVENFVMNAKIDPKVVDGSIHIFKLVDGTVCNTSIKNCGENLLTRMNLGC